MQYLTRYRSGSALGAGRRPNVFLHRMDKDGMEERVHMWRSSKLQRMTRHHLGSEKKTHPLRAELARDLRD